MASYDNEVAPAPPPATDSYEADVAQTDYPGTYTSAGEQEGSSLPSVPVPPAAYEDPAYGDPPPPPPPPPPTAGVSNAQDDAYAPESDPYAAATGAPTPPPESPAKVPSAAHGMLTGGYQTPASNEPQVPDAQPYAPSAPVPPAPAPPAPEPPAPAPAPYTPALPAPSQPRTPAVAKVAPAPPADEWAYTAGGAARSYPTVAKVAAAQKKEEQYYRRALTDALASAEYEATGMVGYGKGAKVPKKTSVRDVELQMVLKYAFYRDPTDEELTKVKSKLGAADEYGIDSLVNALKEEEPAYGLPETKLLRRQDHIFRAWHGGRSRKQVFEAMAQHTKLFKIANVMLAVIAVVVLVLASWQLARLSGSSADSVVLVLCSSLVIVTSLIGLYGVSRLQKDLQLDEDGKETTAQRETRLREHATLIFRPLHC